MTLNLKLANGVNPFRTALTPSRYLFLNPKCLARFKHENSPNRSPPDSESQRSNTSSAPFAAKTVKGKPPATRPSTPPNNFKPTPKAKPYVPPVVVLFHNPASKASLRAKKILEGAQTAFPATKNRIGTPLPLKLTVQERLPTVDEIQDAYLFLEDQTWSKFLTLEASTFRTHATSPTSILEIIQKYREHKLETLQGNEVSSSASLPNIIPESADEDPTDDSLLDLELVTLPSTHPLFGTECFAWPLIVWNSKYAQIAPGEKSINRQLYKYARRRDGVLSPEERQAAKDEAKERALQARAEELQARRQVSPEEGDTIRWYNESSKRQIR